MQSWALTATIAGRYLRRDGHPAARWNIDRPRDHENGSTASYDAPLLPHETIETWLLNRRKSKVYSSTNSP